MNNIQKLSKFLKYGFYGAAGLNLVASFLFFFNGPFMRFMVASQSYKKEGSPSGLPVSVDRYLDFSVGHKILVWLSTLPTEIFYALALYSAAKLLSLYEKGEYFSKQTARHFGNIGKFYIAFALIRFLQEPLFTAVITMKEPTGQRFFTVSADNHDLSAIMFALMIILVGWVMREAVKIQQDQDLTV